VIYLVFNEGYFASSGESLTRSDLSGEAIRLGRLLAELLPEPEVMGLLALIDAILARGDLADYHLAHAARADLYRRLGRTAEARVSYGMALALAHQEPERRFLERRLAESG
jgi:RNA polymerase sigma-70 factor (ECF subfamily)